VNDTYKPKLRYPKLQLFTNYKALNNNIWHGFIFIVMYQSTGISP
jgi:hypothetical protein